jgi:hypothetical protein
VDDEAGLRAGKPTRSERTRSGRRPCPHVVWTSSTWPCAQCGPAEIVLSEQTQKAQMMRQSAERVRTDRRACKPLGETRHDRRVMRRQIGYCRSASNDCPTPFGSIRRCVAALVQFLTAR